MSLEIWQIFGEKVWNYLALVQICEERPLAKIS